MKKTKFKKVALIGVGLIGSSLVRDLIKHHIVSDVVGYDIDKKNLNYAVKNKIIKRAGRSLENELGSYDLVIFATPVLTLEKQVRDLATYINPKALVIDVGSTKEKIVRIAEKAYPKGNFVGCHPMAGREVSGAKSSVLGLYQGAPCLLVKTKNTKAAFYNRAQSLWRSVGAHVMDVALKEHDRYLAACSHLPHVLSFALMTSVAQKIKPQALKKMAGQSFKSYTRVAGSDAQMWTDIFLDNQRHVLSQIKSFRKDLERFEKLVENKDVEKIFNYINHSASLWRKI